MTPLLKRILAAFTIFFGSVMISKGQSGATASVSATIVSPLELTISQKQDTFFSSFEMNSSNSNKVSLTPKKSMERNKINMTEQLEKISVADFSLTNLKSSAYSITLPSIITLTHSSGEHKISANTFLNEDERTNAFFTGSKNFHLSLHLALNELKDHGIFTSNTFAVTINHN